MPTTLDPVILPGQIWEATRGKHIGLRVEVLRNNGLAVQCRPVKGNASKWHSAKSSGKVWSVGINAFLAGYKRAHESGGRDPHSAPLPPAALREPMPIFIDESIPEPLEPLAEPVVMEPRITGPLVKACSRCREIKSLDLFSRNTARVDGYQIYCKACIAITRKPRGKTIMGAAAILGMTRADINLAKFEALPVSQREEIRELREAGISRYEIMKQYSLNGAVYGMIIRENDPKPNPTPAPEAPKPTEHAYTVTVLVMRPVEEQTTIFAGSLVEAAQKAAEDGDVISVVRA